MYPNVKGLFDVLVANNSRGILINNPLPALNTGKIQDLKNIIIGISPDLDLDHDLEKLHQHMAFKNEYINHKFVI